jgi:hypothetical protein
VAGRAGARATAPLVNWHALAEFSNTDKTHSSLGAHPRLAQGPRSWNGSWNGSPDNPSAAGAVSAITRAIGAASASTARDRVSRNAPLAGFRLAAAPRSGHVLAHRGVASRRWVMSKPRSPSTQAHRVQDVQHPHCSPPRAVSRLGPCWRSMAALLHALLTGAAVSTSGPAGTPSGSSRNATWRLGRRDDRAWPCTGFTGAAVLYAGGSAAMASIEMSRPRGSATLAGAERAGGGSGMNCA